MRSPNSCWSPNFSATQRGAFTGARREGHIGLLEQAAGGSVLLDEDWGKPLALQVKLLRFVQHREFFRIGGSAVRTVDVRIIAATNQNLEEMVEARLFRIDLFYRLNVLSLPDSPAPGNDRRTPSCWPIIFCRNTIRNTA